MTSTPPPIQDPLSALLNAAKNAVKGFLSFLPTKEGSDGNKTIFEQIWDMASDAVKKGKEILTPEILKLAISYEEHNFETLSFEGLVGLIKKSFSLKPGMRICVLMQSGKNDYDPTTLEIMALDEQNNIQTSASLPWCHIVIAKPDASLLQAFNGKSMLILK